MASSTPSAQPTSKTSGLLSDPKLIRNAICPDWPGYFLTNKNSIVINKAGEISSVKDASKNVSFAPQNLNRTSGKPLVPTLKNGMSKDSPFHN